MTILLGGEAPPAERAASGSPPPKGGLALFVPITFAGRSRTFAFRQTNGIGRSPRRIAAAMLLAMTRNQSTVIAKPTGLVRTRAKPACSGRLRQSTYSETRRRPRRTPEGIERSPRSARRRLPREYVSWRTSLAMTILLGTNAPFRAPLSCDGRRSRRKGAKYEDRGSARQSLSSLFLTSLRLCVSPFLFFRKGQ